MDDFEKRWKRIQQQLGAEARGDEPHMFSSGRTLFGIKSSVELKMEQIAREDEEKRRQERLARIRAERAKNDDEPDADDENVEGDSDLAQSADHHDVAASSSEEA